MNRRINEAKYEMAYVLGEFTLKLDNYLRKKSHGGFCEVDCYKVKIKCDELLPVEVIDEVQDMFMLELDTFDVSHSASGRVVAVLYNFNHKKLS